MHAVLAIAIKDLRLLVRDRGAAFFTFIFPLIFAFIFSFVFKSGGGSGSMKVLLLDEDQGKASTTLAGQIQNAGGLAVTRVQDRQQGIEKVRRGEVPAFVVIPKGFQQDADGMFAGRSMTIDAIVDPSRSAETGLLTGKLNELAFRQMFDAFQDTSRMSELLASSRGQLKLFSAVGSQRSRAFGQFFDGLDALSTELDRDKKAKVTDAENAPVAGTPERTSGGNGFKPVTVNIIEQSASDERGPKKSTDFAFPQGIAWALMSCVIGFAASIAAERRRGTLLRLTIAPITKSHVLAGKGLACFITAVGVQVVMIGFGVVMGSHVASWALLVMAILSGSLGFVGLAMLLSTFAKSEDGAGGVARAVPMILAMIGGGTIPLFAMPPVMQTISSVSPFKWAILAVEGAMWRGFSFTEMLVPCGILLACGLVCFLIGVRRLKWD